MMEKVLPHAMLKEKPNLESRIRTLKEDWAIIYDQLRGKDNSGFGWDKHRHMVVAEDVMWDSYISSYKEVGQFKTRSFPYYEQLISIYAKARAIGKYAQIAADIVEELCAEDVANERNPEEGSNENGCEFDISLDEVDVSAAQSQSSNPNKLILHFKEEEKRSGVSEPIYSASLIDATTSLEDNIRTIYFELSRSIAFEMLIHEKSKMIIQEKVWW
ncbi:hypothetical protein GOBAR_DD27402 [Gossypium barbadense]|nr:hypothetical protein GOBAR_DD27402 [Gossypium barbadense]